MTSDSRWSQIQRAFEQLAQLQPERRSRELHPRDLDPELRRAVDRMSMEDTLDSRLPSGHGQGGRPLFEPRKLGRYELRSLAGEGGMGRVYRAFDPSLERNVAVKVLAPTLTSASRWLGRFRREARALGALNHPGILTVHEIGEVAGEHYIATELVEGETLRARLERGPLEPREALEIASQAADALAAAHAQGVFHRDIKPENLMVRRDGLVKVLDFGLAKRKAGHSARDSSTPHGGLLLGSILYMSPEQARAEEIDWRSDVFSLGVVLHEMLTGRRPFGGQHPSEALVSLMQGEAERLPPELEARVPGLGELLARALVMDRKHRDLTAAELRNGLRTLLGGTQDASGPAFSAPLGSVQYARSGEVSIAYQVLGEGEIDLVFVMGWVSHLESFWSEPSFARFLRRLAGFSRVIVFDKRGTGLSDRVPVDQLPTLEQRMDDVRAVMDAVGSERAVLCGVSEGGPMCTLFAATYPERTAGLVMIGSYARRLRDADYPWGPSAEEHEAFLTLVGAGWGGPVGIETRAPSRAADPVFREWWSTYLRNGASPSAALALTRMNAQIDVRPLLSSVRVPTLVIHRSGDRCLVVEEGRYLAARIPGARLAELAGADHLPFVGDQESVLVEIETFLRNLPSVVRDDRVLATVLVAQRVASAGVEGPAHQLDELAARELGPFQCRIFDVSADRLRAAFDGPARAIRAAAALCVAASERGLQLRTGLHTGEYEMRAGIPEGLTVRTAERIAELASPETVIVSSTVHDLVAGAGIRFTPWDVEDFGAEVGELQLFSVRQI